ncbi:MAG: T9SS type A sorting domain-containing protein [bacterium]
MKKLSVLLISLFTLTGSLFSQNFTVITSQLSQVVNLSSEVVYNFQVKNVSSSPLDIYIKKQVLDMPENWSASLCFEFCFAPFLDSVNTTEFNGSPLSPQEIRTISIHVFPEINYGTSNIKLTIGNLSNTTEFFNYNINTIAKVVSVENGNTGVGLYNLEQNYPNPFNPSTNINYYLSQSGFVTLEIYDVLGNKISTLVNEYQSVGSFNVSFTNNNIASGVYYYKLSQNNKFITKKMILEK